MSYHSDLIRNNESFLYYLFGLVYFEQIGFYWLSPASHLS